METERLSLAKKVGTRARAIREEKGLTQREIGAIVGMKHQEVSRFEAGVSDVRLSTLDRIARALRVSVEELAS